MVGFAGYDMPVQYPLGVMGEHNHTRAKAGLFDVSHMGQVIVRGDNPALAFERLVPVDVVGIAPMTQRYALFTNEQGGILDDLMVSNAGDHLFVVVNAACKEQDIALMQQGLPECEVTPITDRALLALQGPAAGAVARDTPVKMDSRFPCLRIKQKPSPENYSPKKKSKQSAWVPVIHCALKPGFAYTAMT
eukprot:snap_masked-scaffold2_size2283618-processed-gene-7.32 protein:Tk00042 transcript:snap_masked-scaffold2_size2283618-processed-gene-7.32-mRNA-1 annotation:"aminomethyltransferase (glycine cleavage system t protein)"